MGIAPAAVIITGGCKTTVFDDCMWCRSTRPGQRCACLFGIGLNFAEMILDKHVPCGG